MSPQFENGCPVSGAAKQLTAVLFQSTHLGKIYTSVTPCDVLVPAAFCYSFRMPATVCFAAHATIHLSMVIERAVATKLIRTYEKKHFQIIFALGIALFSMMNYSFSDTTFYCSAATKTTMNQVSGTCYFIVTMEAFSVVIFGGVYFWNRIRERR
ncbi:unnamed protein product [Heligmosomoides polygyrus]|uniref:G protein-coupled receptor n=1 Tax=Heligmosomoides polygyrus TaxID=6339 RepID=A0A183F5K0_HELPZ|nr:unnamed protein product [Heligmosomoides polygyrus]